MLKPLTVWITTNWKILQETGIPDHLTCLLRSLYAGQEATVRIGHAIMDWFNLGKGVQQGCILSPCLFNLYAEYIMWNAGVDKAQAGIKITGRNINNLRYADGNSLMEDFSGGSDGKESACKAGDPGLIPGSERSPEEGKGNPLQYSCLEHCMDRGAWRAAIQGVAKSQTPLSD